MYWTLLSKFALDECSGRLGRSENETGMTIRDGGIAASASPRGEGDVPAELIKGLEPVAFKAGSRLMRQGELSESAYFVSAGTVGVEAETDYGSVRLSTISAPKLLGEIAALSNLPRTASIIAVSDVEAYVVSRPRLLEFGQRRPDFLASLVGQLGKQLENVNRTLSLYSNALAALQSRDFDDKILEELSNPPPEFAEFSVAFRRFAQEIVGKRRGQDEVASAAIIQNSYLPDKQKLAGTADALSLDVRMRPARNVSGDLYDFFLLDENRVLIAIGDVCGKGIPASLFMAVVMTVLRIAAREEAGPEAMIARANAVLSRDNSTSMFATLFFAILDLRDGMIEYCNCGHNPPIIVSESGSVTSLTSTGLPLAIDPDFPATARRVQLAPTDLLVLFTDGVTEAMNRADEEFTEDRLLSALASAGTRDTERIVELIFDAIDGFVEDAEQSDDITCIALRCRPRSTRNGV